MPAGEDFIYGKRYLWDIKKAMSDARTWLFQVYVLLLYES